MQRTPDICPVSVIIPVYRATFLAEALESVFFQSVSPSEVIVIDDGSPDREQLNAALNRYRGVRVIRQVNAGAGAARNAGLRAARTPWMAFLDADDRWLPDFLRGQLAFLERHPEADLAYSDGMIIGRSALAGCTFMSQCRAGGKATLERLLRQDAAVLLSSVVARREAIQEIGGFDATLRRGQDFDLWLRLARQGRRLAYHDRVLVLHRHHDQQLSGTPLDRLERPIDVLQKALRTMILSDSERHAAERQVRILSARLARERAKERLASGDFAAARTLVDTAWRDIRCWKLQAARIGLRVVPELVRRVYLARVTPVVT